MSWTPTFVNNQRPYVFPGLTKISGGQKLTGGARVLAGLLSVLRVFPRSTRGFPKVFPKLPDVCLPTGFAKCSQQGLPKKGVQPRVYTPGSAPNLTHRGVSQNFNPSGPPRGVRRQKCPPGVTPSFTRRFNRGSPGFYPNSAKGSPEIRQTSTKESNQNCTRAYPKSEPKVSPRNLHRGFKPGFTPGNLTEVQPKFNRNFNPEFKPGFNPRMCNPKFQPKVPNRNSTRNSNPEFPIPQNCVKSPVEPN